MKAFLFLALLFPLATQATTLNCLNPQTQKQYKTRCSKVLDPMKFKRGEKNFVNCLGELQDGYEAGICEKVNLEWQLKSK